MQEHSTDAFGRLLGDTADYMVDWWQRSILYLDVMRRRAEQSQEQAARVVRHVLQYDCDLVIDGRNLEVPVNYLLARVRSAEGQEADATKRPFVIVDPRAGHGPGIGGFKADSEIGVALRAGHPCYFVGFLPEPVEGQTIEDILRAQAIFLEEVIARHPEAEGRPCVVGNCQAGWAVLMLAAVRPELFGAIIVAGSPLSYWAGVHGQYPMRYSGGLLGGSWLTALTSDLGGGKFDGAWLVQNFENQNPANTLWTKQYNLYSKIDTEAQRYLGFERWWGEHVSLNAEEIQFIVDELFVGNKLASGDIRLEDGTVVDLRNIRSPIVVLCSKGDNITPPQQALGWLLDLYDDVEGVRSHGQTVVYSVHDTIGHLGIFVSGSVARKEHDEFASNIDFIDVLPPGLYEAKFDAKGEAAENPDLITGRWVMRCEARTLDDIRAFGGNDLEDDRRFAAAAHLSEINLAAYRTFLQPMLLTAVAPWVADAFRRLHPLRLQHELAASLGVVAPWLQTCAEGIRSDRRPIAADNPCLLIQEEASKWIVTGLDAWRQLAESTAENTFHAIYGSPIVQQVLGIDRSSQHPPRKAGKSLAAQEIAAARASQLRSRFTQGGLREASVRALLYVAMVRDGADERGFEAIRRIRQARGPEARLSLHDFKAMVRDQFEMLQLDQRAAVAAITDLLPAERQGRAEALQMVKTILDARGELAGIAAERFAELTRIFGASPVRRSQAEPAPHAAGGGGRLTDTMIRRRARTDAEDSEMPPRDDGQHRKGATLGTTGNRQRRENPT